MCVLDYVDCPSSAVSGAIQEWIQCYRFHSSEALSQLLTLILKAAGISCSVPSNGVAFKQLPVFIQSLTRLDAKVVSFPHLQECSVVQFFEEEPLKAKKGKSAFGRSYGRIWKQLLKELTSAGLQFEETWIEYLTHILIEISGSRIRGLRFVGCFVAESVSCNWIEALDVKLHGRATVEQQLATERCKKQTKVVVDKMTRLTGTLETYDDHVRQLEGMIERLFEGIWFQRYRDICESIRGVVIRCLSQCCLLLPSRYLTDDYLKFIAWSINDRSGGVRLAAVTGLTKIYLKDDHLLPMREFTVRFKGRLIQMLDDVDDAVAIQITKLMTLWVEKEEISTDVLSHVYTMMTDTSTSMQSAVADLVTAVLKSNARRKWTEEEWMLDGVLGVLRHLAEKQGLESDHIRGSGSEGDGSAAFDVRASSSLSSDFVFNLLSPLYFRLDILQNWEQMVRLVDNVADVDVDYVFQMLTACVRCTVDAPCKKPGRRRKQRVMDDDPKYPMTVALMEKIPQWLHEFQLEKTKVSCVMQMVPCLNAELFVLRGLSVSYKDILGGIVQVLFKHHDSIVLQQSFRTLIHAATQGPEELKSMARGIVKAVARRFVMDLDCQESLQESSEVTRLKHGLDRTGHLLSLAENVDVSITSFEAPLLVLIEKCCTLSNLVAVLGIPLGRCLFLLVLHGLSTDADMSTVKNQLLRLTKMMLEGDHDDALKWQAMGLTVDLYLLFSKTEKMQPKEWMFGSLWRLLETRIRPASQTTPNEEQQLMEDVAVLGKLVLFGERPTSELRKLAGQFVSMIQSSVGTVQDFVKFAIRQLRKLDHGAFVDACLRAMMDDRWETTELLGLAQKIAQCYVIFNDTNIRLQVYALVREGIHRAMDRSPPDLKLMSDGLSCFTSRLSRKSCEKLVALLKTMKDNHSLPLDQWQTLDPYLHSLAERARRLRAKPNEADIGEDDQQEPSPIHVPLNDPERNVLSQPHPPTDQIDEPPIPHLSSPNVSLDSKGISEDRVFGLDGWELNLSQPYQEMGSRTTSIQPDSASSDEEADATSAVKLPKMSMGRRVEDDDIPRKNARKNSDMSS